MAQNPLLGKRISLISKKNIRYEGLLYSINEQNMTVALQNVRSYGTEGRELEPFTDPATGVVTTTGQFVPPNEDVHAYLLFRGQDIKDLHVHESQPAEAAAAVVAPSPPAEAITEPAAPTSLPAPNAAPASTAPTSPATQSEDTKTNANSSAPPPKASNAGRGGGRGPRKPAPEGVGTGASLLSRKERRAVTTIEDFDFEQAAEAANVTESATGDAENNVVSAYAKDDFFDSISCEALDKQSGVDNRLRGNQERRLNTETFGAVALNNNNRRRPGGRGGRGGGGRQGTDSGRSSRGNGGYRGSGSEGGRGRGRGRSGSRGGRGRGYGGRQGSSSDSVPRPAATTASS